MGAQVRPSGGDKNSEAVFLRIIVVSSAEQAEQILSELDKGANFAALAQKHSIDSTAADGGSLGTVTLSSLRPELRDALVGVAPGHISAVVKSPLGFTILKVEAEPAPANGGASPANGTTATNAIGSVKQTWGVGGFIEAEVGLYNFDKPAGWDRDPHTICEMRERSYASEKQSLDRYLAPGNAASRASLRPIDLLNTYYSLGEIYSYEGDMKHAVTQYEKARDIATTEEPLAEAQMDESLGVACLHMSEMENGVYRTPGDRCLRPMNPTSAYVNKADSQKAIEYFLKYLEQKPDELEVKWLLNLAYMTTGDYPDRVLKKYLIPPSVFGSSKMSANSVT